MLPSRSSDLAPVLDRLKLALDVLVKHENREIEIETYVVTRAHAAHWRLIQAAEATEICDLGAAQSALLSIMPDGRSRFRRGVERLGVVVRQLEKVLGTMFDRPCAA
jgi:hypothetical protein